MAANNETDVAVMGIVKKQTFFTVFSSKERKLSYKEEWPCITKEKKLRTVSVILKCLFRE